MDHVYNGHGQAQPARVTGYAEGHDAKVSQARSIHPKKSYARMAESNSVQTSETPAARGIAATLLWPFC